MPVTSEYYRPDLAYVHDQSYTDLARSAALHLSDLLKDRNNSGDLIVDLGSGSGVLAKALGEQNFKVIGIDYSPDMVKLAEGNAPDAEFIVASFLDYALPRCAAVTAIGEVLNYRFDKKHNFETLVDLFRKVYEQLEHGGIFLFDLIEPGIEGIMTESNKIVEGDDWTMFLHLFEDWESATLTREITLFRKVGEFYRKSYEEHRVQLLHHHKVQSALEEIGFSVELINQYADLAFRDKHVGFVARKG
ncbi:MAG: SAM-dependent methyltransferase [Saprospiraceae bacterium]|nr:MAG: SAM-dependent methyltransferase [Saprospiraceae bacterium]